MINSPLHDIHVRMGAKLVEFAGWNMPVMYTGIIEEHNYTRNQASVFDVSHMGRLYFTGKDVLDCLERLCTRNLANTQPGQCRYTHICRQDGGILDDVIVSRDENRWIMVCNAANHGKIVDWISEHTAGKDFQINDVTRTTAMVALQGPEAVEQCARLLPVDVKSIKRYRFSSGSFMGFEYVVFRSGYTGEDGFEIVLPANAVPLAMPYILGEGQQNSVIRPAGLGSRDTLRLEAGMPLYGHELTEDWDSITAGQGWCVHLEKDFIGAEAMRKVQAEGPTETIVGLELEGRRTARQGHGVFAGEHPVGQITSGCLSPTLGKSIAMAMVKIDRTEPGTQLEVEIHGKRLPAKVVKLPFYKRNS